MSREFKDTKLIGRKRPAEQELVRSEKSKKRRKTSPLTYLEVGGDMSAASDYATSQEAARKRLTSATERQEKRVARGGPFPKRGQDLSRQDYSEVMKRNTNRIEAETPFGSGYLGRGPFNLQPLVGLEPDEWGSSLLRTNYDVLSSGVASGGNESAILTEMSQYMATNGPVTPSGLDLTDREGQSATALSTILTSAETHKLRNEVGGKPERAALKYAMAHGGQATFNRKSGAYPPAWAKAAGAKEGGTNAWREMREGERPIPDNTLDMLAYMSDSSDDEA